MESQIERVLILGDKPVMTRPIAAATVLDALPKACAVDQALCLRVQHYLARFTHDSGITHGSLEVAASGGKGADGTVIPNRYGMEENSHWNASGQVYLQASDYILLDVGAVAYQGRTTYSGTMLSIGWDKAQLDIGWRPHWFSPMSDSSMLMSTEAPTMPSVTLSNYAPITRLRLHYELFGAVMSNSDHIVYGDGYTAGHPRLAGLHLDMEPATGWSVGISRLLQYGGGARGGSGVKDLFNALFNPSKYDNTTSASGAQVGNQQASFTSNFIFPGRVPFNVYFEYAGEDTSHGRNYLLGNSSLSAGIHFPRLWQRFNLTLETTEWQNAWYVHSVYLDGMTNDGRVIGNWFGDQRVPQDGVGGRSGMVSLGYDAPFGGQFQVRYRTSQNDSYGGNVYKHYQDVSLGYSRPWRGVVVGGQVDAGKDVFGASFARLAGFVRYDENGGGLASTVVEALSDNDSPLIPKGELFIDAGANGSRQSVDLTGVETRTTGEIKYGYHFAVGARRAVSEHNDLGARIEVDQVQSHNLIGVRALDYRYRFNGPLALSFFMGANRYSLATVAYGIYLGAGAQWRNVLPGWDLGWDVRYADNIQRDHLLPSDPPDVGSRNDSFYNVLSTTLFISRHF